MRIRLALPAAAAAAVLVLASCGDEPTETEPGAGTAANGTSDQADDADADADGSADTDESPAADESADDADTDDGEVDAEVAARLDFTATTLDGETFEGVSLAGKPSVLWFWAPWCPKCIGEAPAVADLADTYGDDVNVVGVAGLDEEPAMHGFVSDYGVEGFEHLSDQDGVVWRHFGVTEQSVYVLLDAEGNPQHTGSLSPNELTNQVAELAS